LLSKDEINLEKNVARKAWTEECVRKASEIASGITKSRQALNAWESRAVTNELKAFPGPRDTHYVVVQLENDLKIVENSVAMASKYPINNILILSAFILCNLGPCTIR
jgi:hypothetical protein